MGARSLVITPDGATAIVTGIVDNTTPDAFSKDIDTIAYDIATGDIVWSAPYDSGGWDDSFASVGISPDGATVVVAGSSDRFTATGFDAQIIAYDAATGTQQWSRRYTSAGDQLDAATSVTVTASAAIITGISSNATTGRDYNTIAFDLGSGATLWRNRADGSAHLEDDGLVVAATHDGATVVVTGQSTGDETGFDFLTIAYDAATGKQLWKQRYDGPAHADDLVAYSMLAISPDDTAVYVSGTSPGVGTGTDVVALAYPLPT